MIVNPEVIRDIREKASLSKAEFAEILGISESHLYSIETGRRKPNVELLEQIAKLSGVPFEKVLDVSQDPNDPNAARIYDGLRMFSKIIQNLRRERQKRIDLEERNSELEHAMGLLLAHIQLHSQFEDIICQKSLSPSEKQEKMKNLARITTKEGEISFEQMLAVFRVKRELLEEWVVGSKPKG